jgi:outer membrane protein assembly factor BamB
MARPNRLDQQRVEGGGSFTASPVAASGKLYIAVEDRDLYVLKAGPQYELIAKNPMGEAILATPALAGDLLILRGDKHLFAIAERGL